MSKNASENQLSFNVLSQRTILILEALTLGVEVEVGGRVFILSENFDICTVGQVVKQHDGEFLTTPTKRFFFFSDLRGLTYLAKHITEGELDRLSGVTNTERGGKNDSNN